MKTKYSLFLLAFIILFCATISAQQNNSTANAQDLQILLPIDPNVTIGKLDNGITYYIRTNKKPEKRAELRLVVNAGSVLEDDDQNGLAHLCEHLAFNGTKNFNKQELVNYLESIGMRFGPELNAYTSFDETVYMLTVPTDKDSIVKTAFQILEDWAHNVSYDSVEIDKERGVVIEEWRLGRGAEARMSDKQFPILFTGSKYAERNVIGKKEILESFKHPTLKSFYKDWYRPDLMAVVAIGDFDKSEIENLIKTHFSKIPPRTKQKTREIFPVPNHKEPLFAIATDVEATRSGVSVYYKHELRKEKTVGDYRKKIVEGLYDGMFNSRLEELARKSDPPFLYAYSGGGRFVRSKELYVLSSGVKDNGIERGLETLLTEAARIKKFGFTFTELERQKKDLLRSMEQAYNERDKTESGNFTYEYVSNFLDEEPIPGIDYEYKLYQQYLSGITLEEVNRLAGERISEENRVVIVNAPEKKDLKVPTQEDLSAIFKSIEKSDIKGYDDKVSTEPLIANPPAPGTIKEENLINELGVTEWSACNFKTNRF
jgi:zinc protease